VRNTPDFAYNADLTTPFWTYESNYGGLQAVYGTSAGAPQWAGLIALADQALALKGIGSLDGATQTIPELYNLASLSYSTYFNDIVDGNNGYQAGAGYDLVTGIGTPVADQIVEGLVNSAQPPGGAAALGNADPPIVPREGLQLASPPGPSSRLVPLPTLLIHPGSLAPNFPAGLNASANQAALLFSASLGRAFEPSQIDSGAQSLLNTIALAGPYTKFAVPMAQPAPARSTSIPEGWVESGGGDSAVLSEESQDAGGADTETPIAIHSDHATAFCAASPSPLPAAAANGCAETDAWFARGGSAVMTGAHEAVSTVVLPDPIAATGTVAIALGGYWARLSAIGKKRKG
jgi:hypothetical protein